MPLFMLRRVYRVMHRRKPDMPLVYSESASAVANLRTYMTIGGMPEIVSNYVSRRDLLAAMDTLDDLLLVFQDDFAKYRRRVPLARLTETFRSVAHQSSGKFVCARVSRETKSTAIRDALELLVKAGLVLTPPLRSRPA